MANFLQSSYLPTQPRTDENFNLLAQVQLMKQQKYDVNQQKIQETLDAWGMQQVLRPQDKEYIANKLSYLTDTINGLGNRDLSLTNVTNDINSKIAIAAQDPRITNALENTRKYQSFSSQVAQTREKNPELYSDLNYQDALDLSGFEDYMAGRTESLGNLQYNPYVDVPKKINDATADWAKNHGYRREFSRENNGYFFINTEKEVLTENEVINYINSSIDPQTARQLQINARQTYKNIPEQDFVQQAQGIYDSENIELSTEISRLQAGKANLNKEAQAVVDERISDYNERIQNNKKKINSGNYDRNSDIYTLYNRSFLKSIAQNYVKDEVVDVSYDDSPLDLLKFQADQTYREETLKLKRIEMGLTGSNAPLGTQTVGEAEAIDVRRPQDILTDNLTRSKVQLDTILTQTNRDGYNTKSEQEKRNYRASLAKESQVENINALGYDEQLMDAINTYSVSLNDSQAYKQTVVNGVSPLISGAYNDIATSKSNRLLKQNLSATMPTVAKYAQQGVAFENITNIQDKQLIKYELASNFIQYDSSLTDDEKEALNVYTKNLEQQGINTTATKEKIVAQKRMNSNDDGIITSFGKGVVNSVMSGMYYLGGGVGSLIDPIFKSEAEADKNRKQAFQTAENYNDAGNINQARIQNLKRDYFGAQDTNVTEIESFETASGNDLRNSFKTGLSAVSKTAKAVANQKAPENIRNRNAFSFSTENKPQSQVAKEIGTTIQAQFPDSPIPSPTNNYTIEKTGETYSIFYNTGTGQKVERTSVEGVRFENLPSSIRPTFQTEDLNWKNSMKNPNAVQKTFSYTLPKTATERVETIDRFRTNYPNSLTDDAYFQVLQNPSQSQFATAEELKRNIIKKYGQQFYNSNAQNIDAILNSEYRTNIKVAPNHGFVLNTILNNQIVASTVLPGDYNQAKSLGASMQSTLTAIENQIAELYSRNQ